MTETQASRYEHEQIKAKAAEKINAFRNHRFIKPTLAILAVGVGAYLGTKHSMAKISKDVHEIADRAQRIDNNIYEIGIFMGEEATLRETRISSDRRMIEDSILNGTDVVNYPGVGVLNRGALLADAKK